MLCEECLILFNTSFSREKGWKHYYWFASHKRSISWSRLKYSAEICYICHRCTDEVLRQFPDVPDECQLNIKAGLSLHDTKENDDIYISTRIEPEGWQGFAHFLMHLLSIPAQDLYPTVKPPKADSTGSSSSLDFARSCLTRCVTGHAMCRNGVREEPWFPTRLIEIRADKDTSHPGKFTARLISTKDHRPDGTYCSLSHCWGKVELFKLLTNNIAQLSDGLDLDLLPQTFLDAMQVAQSLDIHYIWIDTLCILQDSPEDWRYEASRMFEVYLYAYLNIAATKAEDASKGLFAERDSALLAAIVKLDHGPRPGNYQLLDRKYWSHMVDEAVLNQRAWVLQERLLSSRTLPFASDQIIWDCCESVHFETFKDQLDERGRRVIGPTGPKCNQNLFSMQATDAENGDKWLEVVHSYSKSLLSFQSDKLFALSGLVKQFETSFRDSYYAGMWKRSMSFHLTWYIQNSSKTNRKQSESRAPSWSWLVYDGAVLIPTAEQTPDAGYERVKLAEIVDVDVTQVRSDIGDIFQGYLELRASLTLLENDDNGGLQLTVPVRPPFKADQTRIQCRFDYDPTDLDSTSCFFYVPIWCLLYHATTMKYKDACEIHGLIIRVKEKMPLTYERCGHACLFTNLTESFRSGSSYSEAVLNAGQTSDCNSSNPDILTLNQTTIRLV